MFYKHILFSHSKKSKSIKNHKKGFSNWISKISETRNFKQKLIAKTFFWCFNVLNKRKIICYLEKKIKHSNRNHKHFFWYTLYLSISFLYITYPLELRERVLKSLFDHKIQAVQNQLHWAVKIIYFSQID